MGSSFCAAMFCLPTSPAALPMGVLGGQARWKPLASSVANMNHMASGSKTILCSRILGCSTYGRPELVSKALHPEVRADYLGSGAVFATRTKQSEAKEPSKQLHVNVRCRHVQSGVHSGGE
ncbi:unnamed protein product [Effrenium voratum]|nr:unnamed protein product [Effrenium voratum]